MHDHIHFHAHVLQHILQQRTFCSMSFTANISWHTFCNTHITAHISLHVLQRTFCYHVFPLTQSNIWILAPFLIIAMCFHWHKVHVISEYWPHSWSLPCSFIFSSNICIQSLIYKGICRGWPRIWCITTNPFQTRKSALCQNGTSRRQNQCSLHLLHSWLELTTGNWLRLGMTGTNLPFCALFGNNTQHAMGSGVG